MNQTFLIARQEFIKYVTRRGFFISILMFPIYILLVAFVPRLADGGESPRIITIVDETGGQYREAILSAIGLDNETRNLAAIAHYAASYADAGKLKPVTAAMLAHPDTQASRRVFENMGGLDAVRAEIAPRLKPNAPAFTVPTPRYVYAAPPADLAAHPGQKTIAKALAAGGPFAIDAVVVVPRGFGPDAPQAAFWSTTPRGSLREFVDSALSDALRLAAVRRVAPNISDRELLTDGADLEAHSSSHSDGDSGAFDEVIPIALAIILFVVSVMNSSVLLQGVIEEKSTKMIEVLLSCATPREITTGKLIGVIAVAITTLLIWGAILVLMMLLADHQTVVLALSSLRAVATLNTVPLLLLYFLCGLLIYGSLFLAIGSMAASLADAQSLLGPSMLILMLPNLMINAVVRDPNGTLASTLTWIPFYTPFFMMLRIASHPPAYQVWGAVALMLVTTTLMIVWTGRIFARHVLTTERPPSLGNLVRGLLGRGA
jgi:ABC-2 type transport system permease protein